MKLSPKHRPAAPRSAREYHDRIVAARHRRKLGRELVGQAEGSTMVLVCRIGDAEHVPPGCGTSECGLCLEPVWITRQSEDLARSAGLPVRLLCNRCLLG